MMLVLSKEDSVQLIASGQRLVDSIQSGAQTIQIWVSVFVALTYI